VARVQRLHEGRVGRNRAEQKFAWVRGCVGACGAMLPREL
jgi:hypothetical protein